MSKIREWQLYPCQYSLVYYSSFVESMDLMCIMQRSSLPLLLKFRNQSLEVGLNRGGAQFTCDFTQSNNLEVKNMAMVEVK